MSLSAPNPDKVTNPCKKFIKFSGEIGEFSFFCKETKENTLVPIPFTFTVLDQLATITGYDQGEGVALFSNEVRNTQVDELNVRAHPKKDSNGKVVSKGREVAKGFYQAIKADIVAAGGKYTSSVYAYMNGEIVNFQFRGSSLSPWIEKNINVQKNSITVTGTTEEKKGKITYKMPVFKAAPLQDLEAATEADKELQVYLASYLTPNLSGGRPTEDTRESPLPEEQEVDAKDWDLI